MRGIRRFTFVPSLSAPTTSATGAFSTAVYFGFAIRSLEYTSGQRPDKRLQQL
jgi:hypothetical protein